MDDLLSAPTNLLHSRSLEHMGSLTNLDYVSDLEFLSIPSPQNSDDALNPLVSHSDDNSSVNSDAIGSASHSGPLNSDGLVHSHASTDNSSSSPGCCLPQTDVTECSENPVHTNVENPVHNNVSENPIRTSSRVSKRPNWLNDFVCSCQSSSSSSVLTLSKRILSNFLWIITEQGSGVMHAAFTVVDWHMKTSHLLNNKEERGGRSLQGKVNGNPRRELLGKMR
ncbi:hypothetical protein V6N11_010626 [Hibiscus sabdariffa]|uniref:Uncharacterized protein n=1 Tax=Hibiscus sabdariffa TaxID=183260 RepID=A0ABR2S5U6_9ROSI